MTLSVQLRGKRWPSDSSKPYLPWRGAEPVDQAITPHGQLIDKHLEQQVFKDSFHDHAPLIEAHIIPQFLRGLDS